MVNNYLKYFKIEDFACPCCGVNKINPVLVEKLDDLRLFLGEEIIVFSAYRCEKLNERCGGSVDSYHTIGKAIDFRPETELTPEKRYYFLREIICQGFFKGIGIYKNHFHLDSRENNSCWIDF